MKKIYKIILVVVAVLALLAGGLFFYKDKLKIGLPIFGDNLDTSEKIFAITAPDNFDDFRKGRLQEKIDQAKLLYAEKPNDTWTWIVIGNMYEYAKDYDRAIIAYKKTVSINDSEYISRLNLAYIYENQKQDYSTAEKYYKEVLELTPTNPENYLNLAKLYDLKIQAKDLAETIYLDGLKKTGNNPDLLVAMINFYQKYNDQENAIKYAKVLLQNFPDDERYKNDFGSLIK